MDATFIFEIALRIASETGLSLWKATVDRGTLYAIAMGDDPTTERRRIYLAPFGGVPLHLSSPRQRLDVDFRKGGPNWTAASGAELPRSTCAELRRGLDDLQNRVFATMKANAVGTPGERLTAAAALVHTYSDEHRAGVMSPCMHVRPPPEPALNEPPEDYVKRIKENLNRCAAGYPADIAVAMLAAVVPGLGGNRDQGAERRRKDKSVVECIAIWLETLLGLPVGKLMGEPFRNKVREVLCEAGADVYRNANAMGQAFSCFTGRWVATALPLLRACAESCPLQGAEDD